MSVFDQVQPAQGDPSPAWPVPGIKPRVWTHGGKAFRAQRAGGSRFHVGIDLFAPPGEIVVATEAGVIVRAQHFLGGSWALLLQADSGPVFLFGEVTKGSWNEFGIVPGRGSPPRVGTRVKKGQAIARVALLPGGSSMLHFEAYSRGSKRNQSWKQSQLPHPSIRNPTHYLQLGAANLGTSHDAYEGFPWHMLFTAGAVALSLPLFFSLRKTTRG